MYDSSDRVCEDCPVRRACKVVVDKDLRKVARERTYRSRYGRGGEEDGRHESRPKENSQRTDPHPDDTFFGALVYNGFLSATKAILMEAHHGVDSNPHMRYPNPFLALRRRAIPAADDKKEEDKK